MRVNEAYVEIPIDMLGGMEFQIQQSDGEIYHNGLEVLAKCLRLDVSDPDAVLIVLKDVCSAIDDALGAGAMKQIVGNQPVSLPVALAILNQIIRICGERYTQYIRGEYLGGKRNEKVQPVKP